LDESQDAYDQTGQKGYVDQLAVAQAVDLDVRGRYLDHKQQDQRGSCRAPPGPASGCPPSPQRRKSATKEECHSRGPMRPAGGQVGVEQADALVIGPEVDEVGEHDHTGNPDRQQDRPRDVSYETTTSGGLTKPLTWA
jgi:hypothetical protein